MTKVCSRCKAEKPLDQFHRARNKAMGRYQYCKPCRRDYDATRQPKINEAQKRWREEHPERWSELQRTSRLKREYGITQAEYERMYLAQEGRCAICRDWSSRLCVDHDHLTSVVRGLLCDGCNKGLGCFRDDPAILLLATGYLRP